MSASYTLQKYGSQVIAIRAGIIRNLNDPVLVYQRVQDGVLINEWALASDARAGSFINMQDAPKTWLFS